MGNIQSSVNKINFEDMQYAINDKSYILVNTLNVSEQECLINNTIKSDNEEKIINELIKHGKYNINIVVYGKNTNDETIFKKYNQLISLSFKNVFLYQGGLFEWLMLQDIYGSEEFPTTTKMIDILKFKPPKKIGINLLEYGHI